MPKAAKSVLRLTVICGDNVKCTLTMVSERHTCKVRPMLCACIPANQVTFILYQVFHSTPALAGHNVFSVYTAKEYTAGMLCISISSLVEVNSMVSV